MTVFVLRLFIFIILPVLFAVSLIYPDKSIKTRERRIEIFLIFLFGLGAALVAGSLTFS